MKVNLKFWKKKKKKKNKKKKKSPQKLRCQDFKLPKTVLWWGPLRRKYWRSLEWFESNLKKQCFDRYGPKRYDVKENGKKLDSQNIKNSNSNFVTAVGIEILERSEIFSGAICMRSSVFLILLPWGLVLNANNKNSWKGWKRLFQKLRGGGVCIG